MKKFNINLKNKIMKKTKTDKDLLSRALLEQGRVYANISKHREDAKKILEEALEITISITKGVPVVSESEKQIYEKMGVDYQKFERANSKITLASIYETLGMIYSFEETIDNSVKYYTLAIENSDAELQISTLETIHCKIAQLYQRTNDPKFIEHLMASGKYASHAGHPDTEWEIYLYLGSWYYKNNQHDLSISTTVRVLDLIQQAMKNPLSKLHNEEVGPWPDLCTSVLEACTAKLYHPKLQKNFVKRVIAKLRELQEIYPTAFPKANDYCVVVIDRHMQNLDNMNVTWKL
jgi:tetratricopeptide (TPR) repeat protein